MRAAEAAEYSCQGASGWRAENAQILTSTQGKPNDPHEPLGGHESEPVVQRQWCKIEMVTVEDDRIYVLRAHRDIKVLAEDGLVSQCGHR